MKKKNRVLHYFTIINIIMIGSSNNNNNDNNIFQTLHIPDITKKMLNLISKKWSTDLWTWSKALDGGDCNEAEALIQVFIGRASFQQGERDEIQFPFQYHH